VDVLQVEQEQTVINILKSWQYTKASGFFAMRCMEEAMLAIWGALAERKDLRGVPVHHIKGWILAQFFGALSGWNYIHRAMSDLEQASETFAGGPLVPLFIQALSYQKVSDIS
jgi:hypothetical protein